jgi:enoyl-CoA hydratase
MGYETILYEVRSPAALVTLNRPHVLNALSSTLIHEVSEALNAAEADPAVRAVILKGAGRAFCPGYDLKETAQKPPKGVVEWRKRLEHDVRFTLRVWDLKKPVIAAVHGFCLGGGCDLAMMCDITIAAEGTLFGEPEIRFGSGVVTMIMPWVVGLKKSKELLYTGHDKIDAREAMAMGMVNRVVPLERLEAEAIALAKEIAQIDAEAIALTKAAINRTFEIAGLKAGIEYNLEIDTLLEAAETPERVEFNRLRKDKGLQAALAWRNARFDA